MDGVGRGCDSGSRRSWSLDSKFSVLPSVVAEGRRVLGNTERVSDLFLTKSFYSGIYSSLITVVLTLTSDLPGRISSSCRGTRRSLLG